MYTEDLRILNMIYGGCGRSTPETLLLEMTRIQNPKISGRMLEKISGVSIHRILHTTGKKSRTGGNLNPQSLLKLLELTISGWNDTLVIEILKEGTSQQVIAALTGFSQSRISRVARRKTET